MIGVVRKSLGMLMTGNVRGLVSFLLGLALLGALWETSLVNVSSRPTATAIMTEVGAEIINPLLLHNSFGVSQTLYNTLEQQANSQPSKPITVPGINTQKVVVLGSDIKGKSFDDGTRVIYSKVAAAYYDTDGKGILNVPSGLSDIVSTISLLPQAVANQAIKGTGAPQPPAVPLPPLGAAGLSLSTLTASGHAQVQTLDYWFLGAALLLALLLTLFGRGWGRITSVGWAVISSAIPGLFGIGAIAFLWSRNPGVFQPYAGLLHAIEGAFVPVYVGAAALGVALLILARVGDFATKVARAGSKVEQHSASRLAARPSAGRGQAGGGSPTPSYRRPSPAPQQYRSPDPFGQGQYGPLQAPPQPYPSQASHEAWTPAPAPSSPWPSSGSGSAGGSSAWPPSSAGGAQWSSSPAGAGRSPWPPSPPGDAGWPPSSAGAGGSGGTGWPESSQQRDQLERGSGPVGPSQPAYGRSVTPEPPWGQGGPASPYGQGSGSGQAWPPQDDPDPWPPRRG